MGVSIHALLAECDHQPGRGNDDGTCFNPRTPCGVRLASCNGFHIVSTVSIHALLAECDGNVVLHLFGSLSFNPRTPCGVRRYLPHRGGRNNHGFNPRTPCGVRPSTFHDGVRGISFQSTHSLRSATGIVCRVEMLVIVSIHALLAECDWPNNHTRET